MPKEYSVVEFGQVLKEDMKLLILMGYGQDDHSPYEATFILAVPATTTSDNVMTEYNRAYSEVTKKSPDDWTYQEILKLMPYPWYQSSPDGLLVE